MENLKIEEDIFSLNNQAAQKNRDTFQQHGVFVINIMGSPGAGKTTLLEHILPQLKQSHRIAVIEGDLATENDACRIRQTGVPAVQINTGGGCHLDATMIAAQFSKLHPDKLDLLIIENVGNLVCPISFDLGEDLRMVILSIPEGEDKPLKYPSAILGTDAVVLTKTDLAPFVDVNPKTMANHSMTIHPKVTVLYAGKEGNVYNAAGVIAYIRDKMEAKKQSNKV
jgi:hydrogenase nickel incorporation protein HypB